MLRQNMAMASMMLASLLVFGGGCDRAGDTADLDLGWEEFDQNPDRGWRPLAAREEFAEAALLIETYLERHPDLPAGQRSFLHFHAGQLLALDGLNTRALPHLAAAELPQWPPFIPPTFPHLVHGTRAFLQGDASAVQQAHKAAAATPTPSERDQVFIEALELLATHPDLTYRQVYQLAIQ